MFYLKVKLYLVVVTGKLLFFLTLPKMLQAIFNILLLTENFIFTTLKFLVYDLMRYFTIDRKFKKSLNLYRVGTVEFL